MVWTELRNPRTKPLYKRQFYRTEGMTDAEEEAEKVKIDEEAEDKMTRIKNYIKDMDFEIVDKKPFRKWEGEKQGQRQITREYCENFLGQKVPQSDVVIPKFLKSQYATDMQNLIIKSATEEHIISRRELTLIIRYLVIRIICRNSHRKDVVANLSMGEWFQRKRHVSNPSAPSIKGDIIKVTFHKTGHKYVGYLFLTEIDLTFLHLYVKIRENYLTSIGENPMALSQAFFINSKGEPALAGQVPVYLEDFNREAGITGNGAHMFRRMFTDFTYNHENGALREEEAFAACHSKDIAATWRIHD